MVLKYVVNNYPFPTLYFGVANVIANGLIMLRYASTTWKWRGKSMTDNFNSSIVLWISQNMEDDYTYNLAL